jgi:hypothetical protein
MGSANVLDSREGERSWKQAFHSRRFAWIRGPMNAYGWRPKRDSFSRLIASCDDLLATIRRQNAQKTEVCFCAFLRLFAAIRFGGISVTAEPPQEISG